MGKGKSGILRLIPDKRKRVHTFHKRKSGLEKKAYELATLCDVNISMIMFGSDDEVEAPTIWPEDHNVATKMINLYQKDQIIDYNCSRNVDIASIYKDRVRLVGKEVEKLKKQSFYEKYPMWDESYESLSCDQLLEFGNALNNVLQGLKPRIDSMQIRQMFQPISSDNQLQLQGLKSSNDFMNKNQMFQGISSYNQFKPLNISSNCFGSDSEGAAVLHNYQSMKIMDETSSRSNNYNFNYNYNYNNNGINTVPTSFDYMTTNTKYDLPPFPGIEDNFVQNNNNMVMDESEPQLCYAPLQVQMPIFKPRPLASIDSYEEFDNTSINQFGGNFNFQY